MRKVVFVADQPAFSHTFYLSQENIPVFQQVFKDAKEKAYFLSLIIDDIKYGANSHVLCTSLYRMHESTLMFVFDMCNGYELNTPIIKQCSLT